MSLTGHREESFRVELLTNTEKSLGDLDGVSGGSLSWNANADLPGSGSISLQDRGQNINTSKDRVRVWWQVADYGEWPLGVYVMAAPSRFYTGAGSSRDLTLLDKLTVIKDDRIKETLQFSAGSNIIDSVVSVIQSTGETRIASTASGSVLTNDVAWEPGTSKLSVVNSLLSAAGYWGLWTDRYGQFRVEPYIAPADRPVVWEFQEGETSIHSPEWTYEIPLWEATNLVVLISQADDDGNFWTATAEDDNPASPTSTVSMGRVLNPIVEENVEASSQLDLQQQANRRLISNSNTVGRLSVQHAPIPLWYNEAVSFSSQGVSVKATVIKQDLTLQAGSLVSAEWRQS